MAKPRMTKGEQLLLGGSLLLVGLSLVPAWASHHIAGAETELKAYTSAWGHYGFVGNLALLVSLSAVLLLGLALVGVRLDVHRSELAYLCLAGVTAGLLLIAAIAGPQRGPLEHDGYRVQRGPLLYVGLALAGVAFYGAHLHRLAVGTTRDNPETLQT